FLSSFVLASFGMYLLMLRVTRNRYAAFVAGVAFAFAPYRLASLAHIQLLTVQWLPFVAYGLWQMADSGWPIGDSKWRSSPIVLLWLFLWLQIASTLHGALFAALMLLVFLIIHTIRASRTTYHPSTSLPSASLHPRRAQSAPRIA